MAEKVMVAMSGGVDSSVAAALLVQEGYEVCGATLKLFSGEDIGFEASARSCCSLADVQDARSVADALGFDHFVFNFGDRFKEEVIDRFAKAYLAGATPNPCIDCNRYIKFEKLLERALFLDMDYVATGHYVRREFNAQTGRWLLKKGVDPSKDQSYVLYAMTQEQLSRTLFPLGALTKEEVRVLAERLGFVNADKPDSQDICFVQSGSYTDFLERVLGLSAPPGDFVDMSGRVLGRHKGILHYTVGQRRGLHMSFDRPKYVVRKDPAANTVVIGDEADLYSDSFTAGDVNLIALASLEAPVEAAVKTRYSHREAPATLSPLPDGRIFVRFYEPQRAVTSGQAAVFYDGDVVLGGGTIL